jgi:hypothetical protein
MDSASHFNSTNFCWLQSKLPIRLRPMLLMCMTTRTMIGDKCLILKFLQVSLGRFCRIRKQLIIERSSVHAPVLDRDSVSDDYASATPLALAHQDTEDVEDEDAVASIDNDNDEATISSGEGETAPMMPPRPKLSPTGSKRNRDDLLRDDAIFGDHSSDEDQDGNLSMLVPLFFCTVDLLSLGTKRVRVQ